MGKIKNDLKRAFLHNDFDTIKPRKRKANDGNSKTENETPRKKRLISKKSRRDSASSSSTSSSSSSTSSGTTSSSSSSETERKDKKTKKTIIKKRRKRAESCSSTSSSRNSSSSTERGKKKSEKKKKKKVLTKKQKKRTTKKTSSSSSTSSYSSSTSSSNSDSLDDATFFRKKKKKAKMPAKKIKKGKSKKNLEENVSMDIPINLMEKNKAMAPMTKEEWEKKRSVVTRVYDDSTGRHRLIKGDGEVLEEIVSKDRHKAINQKATKGDGDYFQTKMSEKLKK